MDVLSAFVRDARVLTVVILMVCQVFAAILVAVQQGAFDAALLADYYRKRVIPYLGGAAILYVLTRYLPTGDVLGPYGAVLNDGLFTLAWLTLVWTLLSRLIADLRALGLPIPGEMPSPGTAPPSGKITERLERFVPRE